MVRRSLIVRPFNSEEDCYREAGEDRGSN